LERQKELEMKRKELKAFFGSNTFQLMKDLSNQVVEQYMHLGEQITEDLHFPWIKEYNRFISKCLEEEREDDEQKHSSPDKYNLTLDMNKAKRKHWWYRQKYKLMKALKEKWDKSYKKTYKIIKRMEKDKQIFKKSEVDYNHLQTTTISFEKIPLLKIGKEIEDDNTADSTSLSKETAKNRRKNISTNTGPDIILMLNDLKESRSKHKRRETLEELNQVYKLNRVKLNKSSNSLSQNLLPPNQNPYASNVPKNLNKSKSSGRYSRVSNPQGDVEPQQLDKFRAYRLYNLDRLERQITGKSDNMRNIANSVSRQNRGGIIIILDIETDLVENMRETSKSNKAMFKNASVDEIKKESETRTTYDVNKQSDRITRNAGIDKNINNFKTISGGNQDYHTQMYALLMKFRSKFLDIQQPKKKFRYFDS
jgi:hypothetical protein